MQIFFLGRKNLKTKEQPGAKKKSSREQVSYFALFSIVIINKSNYIFVLGKFVRKKF